MKDFAARKTVIHDRSNISWQITTCQVESRIMTTITIEQVIKKIKVYLNVTTDSAIADALQMHRGTLAKMKKRRTIPYKKIAKFAEDNHVPISRFLGEHYEMPSGNNMVREPQNDALDRIMALVNDLKKEDLPVVEKFISFLRDSKK